MIDDFDGLVTLINYRKKISSHSNTVKIRKKRLMKSVDSNPWNGKKSSTLLITVYHGD
ncbi:5865_t:CDS:2 [Cetraspora pellucida]|uniref:5865_t:CDS:1 n=1 Tax=Cetraspora pellucida TaxID=1433469 RepID=A0A9N9BAT1_9GLOM|nr:5865_t:CDS:2 [Cetraspora pellucida]